MTDKRRRKRSLRAGTTTHGMSRTAEYRIWSSIKYRCTSPNHSHYHRYGGRGITMCKAWADSFEQFLKDMGPRPSPLHSVERRNNDGNYCPGNCYWGTDDEQNNNRHNTVRVEYQGRLWPRAQLAAAFGVPRHVLNNRLRDGWSVHDAVTKPVRPCKPRLKKGTA